MAIAPSQLAVCVCIAVGDFDRCFKRQGSGHRPHDSSWLTTYRERRFARKPNGTGAYERHLFVAQSKSRRSDPCIRYGLRFRRVLRTILNAASQRSRRALPRATSGRSRQSPMRAPTRAAFVGNTITDLLAGILERQPDWGSLPDSTPLAIRKPLMRALEVRTAPRRLR
jgi:hypothetical protein